MGRESLSIYRKMRDFRKGLGALILAVNEGGRLVYAGNAGTGLDQKGFVTLRDRLDDLETDKSPFAETPKLNSFRDKSALHWVEPRLAVEVSFQEWTEDRIMRQPVILGLREDKAPRDHRPRDASAGRQAHQRANDRLARGRLH